MAENAKEKAARLLAEGRLTVLRAGTGDVGAEVKGDSGRIYNVGYDSAARRWSCDCEARGRCSHLIALQLVTVIFKEGETA